MEITVQREDLSLIDCGGGYREATLKIFIDDTLSPIKQRQSLIYEVLSAHLDPLECNIALMTELAYITAEALEQLEP